MVLLRIYKQRFKWYYCESTSETWGGGTVVNQTNGTYDLELHSEGISCLNIWSKAF